ncbi:hypothetical protein Rhe02_37150 [Rhizocola hellebori]|uniref:Uncharacterized protein n=1 Tax=Rhizocola hellebori TaxID=1392758 RepID=A0A8J3Q9G5_9ACTN|nr:hypothetical protein [Rhizocola hellebori]GIH05648.1 hypothetical protein Rhe02_37150 [Rhizocola hellebori]
MPEDLTMRPIRGRDELDLFCGFPYQLNPELADDLDAGRRRPELLWMALRGDRLVARVGWWARQRDEAPLLLDIFDFADDSPDGIDTGVRLLETAIAATIPDRTKLPQFLRFLDPHWQDDRSPSTRREAAWRPWNALALGLWWNACAWNGRPEPRWRRRRNGWCSSPRTTETSCCACSPSPWRAPSMRTAAAI